MKREWKPGDVAMVHIARWPAAREWSDDTSAVLVRVAEDGYMHVVDGDPAAPLCVPPRLIAEYVRPLAVIDPEDPEQVERLRGIVDGSDGPGFSNDLELWQAALREFANPTPPKPEEPTGLGAVVEDAAGQLWVRHQTTGGGGWYVDGVSRQYTDIAAVKVLSEGVTP